ncbi:MAG: amidohydrolase family protein [Halobacteriovoraceae bacterium]|jgi:dihydroorotase|nr:amidohydrolase family protein [Halobacteriovoraceae bacterium]MBT5094865.1 amidohydrolase family protein [Halobacteriovoraceae bacterium]
MEKFLEGLLVDSENIDRGQICFDDETGLIVDVGKLGIPANKVDYRYDDDHYVFAGMGDVHIHAREDMSGSNCYKEDFHSASLAAINGGVTHACDMPNNPIPPIDLASYSDKLNLTKNSLIPLVLYAGIGPSTRPIPGTLPYKAYMGPSVGELFFKDFEELDKALKHYSHQWVSFHCEDPVILENHALKESHYERRPVEAELLATEQAISLIEKYSLNGKLCHYSAGEGLPLIKKARQKGLNLSCEVTPQHLFYSTDKLSAENLHLFQMNPPIRPESDREAMLQGLLDGDIDFIATDHAPHTVAEKKKGISGLTGLDTYAPFVTWLINEMKFDPRIIAKVCSENPGLYQRQFLPTLRNMTTAYDSLGHGIGFLRPGFNASFTILNMNKATKITKEDLKTKAAWSPFEGHQFSGSLASIFLSGKRA